MNSLRQTFFENIGQKAREDQPLYEADVNVFKNFDQLERYCDAQGLSLVTPWNADDFMDKEGKILKSPFTVSAGLVVSIRPYKGRGNLNKILPKAKLTTLKKELRVPLTRGIKTVIPETYVYTVLNGLQNAMKVEYQNTVYERMVNAFTSEITNHDNTLKVEVSLLIYVHVTNATGDTLWSVEKVFTAKDKRVFNALLFLKDVNSITKISSGIETSAEYAGKEITLSAFVEGEPAGVYMIPDEW